MSSKRNRRPTELARKICGILTLSLTIGNGTYAYSFNAESMKLPRRPRFVGKLEKNSALASSLTVAKGLLHGPEDLAIKEDGTIFAGSWKDGEISRISPPTNTSQKVELFAKTGGGNLGLKFDRSGNLIVCNSPGGLLSIDEKGVITTLASRIGNQKINFPDDLDIDSSGKIYFSNASFKYDGHEGRRTMDYDFLEARPNGALLVYDPQTNQTKMVLDGLYFPNGVVLSEDETYLLVAETTVARIQKYWLKGPKAGKSEVFMDNLIGYPDGLARDGHGGYWITFATLRTRYIDVMHYFSFARNLASYGPLWAWEQKPKYGMIIDVSSDGTIQQSLQDSTKKVFNVTNVVPWQGYLFMGTLEGDSIFRYTIDPVSVSHKECNESAKANKSHGAVI